MEEDKYSNRVYSRREWLERALNKCDDQLLNLYALQAKERLKALISLVLLCFYFFLLMLNLFALIYPSGAAFVNPGVHQFLGPICIFLGYFTYKYASGFYEHVTIFKQLSEYIFQHRRALNRVVDALDRSEDGLNEKRY